MRIIEQSDEDIDRRTRELFQEMKPLLDEGYTFTSALKMVKSSCNTNTNWYREIRDYVLSQGYVISKSQRNKKEEIV